MQTSNTTTLHDCKFKREGSSDSKCCENRDDGNDDQQFDEREAPQGRALLPGNVFFIVTPNQNVIKTAEIDRGHG